MAKKIKIRVFNTLESSNLMVSGWYSNKGNPNTRYGLFTGATDGLENEQLVYCQKFMKPNAKPRPLKTRMSRYKDLLTFIKTVIYINHINPLSSTIILFYTQLYLRGHTIYLYKLKE